MLISAAQRLAGGGPEKPAVLHNVAGEQPSQAVNLGGDGRNRRGLSFGELYPGPTAARDGDGPAVNPPGPPPP